VTADRAPAGALLAHIARLEAELVEARETIAMLEARADVDPLLDILNRRGFVRELARALAYLTRYGGAAVLMFVDLDGFKAVNDAHGHAAGDALLRAVARELSADVRASDVVARLGGDEFGVFLWNVDEAEAEAKARAVEALIESPRVPHGAATLSVGASAGIAPVSPGLSAEAVIDAADRAMYARKRERRG
jgi:diguanylate cyclase (GGDEF)-like protein